MATSPTTATIATSRPGLLLRAADGRLIAYEGTVSPVELPVALSTKKLIYSKGSLSATTSGTSEQTALSISIPANTLVNTGDVLNGTLVLTTAANGNSKVVKVKFGGTVVHTATLTTNAGVLKTDFQIRKDAGVNKNSAVYAWTFENGVVGAATAAVTLNKTDTAAITLLVTLTTATQAGDATLRVCELEYVPAVG